MRCQQCLSGSGWVMVATTLFVATFGCTLKEPLGPPVHPSPSLTVPNPVGAVVANCPELVCTQADLPSCDFEQIIQGADIKPIVDRVHCARSQYGTDCEERRAPGGDPPVTDHGQVLKFRCAGDPVECWTTGGNATWETTLDPAREGGRPLRYPCRRLQPAPEPPQQPVPGPDTV
jgi:hypothetical protein